GVRVLVGGSLGFASSNDLEAASWKAAVERAAKLAKAASGRGRDPVKLAEAPTLRSTVDWKAKRDPRNVDAEEKIALLRDMEAQVRTVQAITNVTTAYSDATVSKRFVNSEGTDL